MAWDAFKDWQEGSKEAPFDNFDPRNYTTDWNKNFGKNTEEAKGKNKGLDFLKSFAGNLFGQGQDSQKPYSFGGGGSGGFSSQIAPDITAITTGGGAGQFIPGEKGLGEKLLEAGVGAAIGALL